MTDPRVGEVYALARPEFPSLLTSIRSAGFGLVGPTLRDGAIVYGPIDSESDLPIGWTDRQEAGQYRVERRDDGALFGYAVGPHSWKKYLFPSRERLFTLRRDGTSFAVEPEPVAGPPLAFLGVRACEIAALRITDRVFDGAVADPGYRARRRRVLAIAVECGVAGGTCFCASMGTGPAVRDGFDLALTEILGPGPHRFLVRIGSEAGARAARLARMTPAGDGDRSAARTVVEATAGSMGRTMPAEGVRELLLANLEHPRWDDVARRCLSCTNCTMACPTCFCHTTEEVPDLAGERVERWRRWDSCFNLAFSGLHQVSVRKSPASRYRQWLTHKLATWHDQFGSSGCVGCGRCITWCPVGIDLTEEVAAIRARPGAAAKGASP